MLKLARLTAVLVLIVLAFAGCSEDNDTYSLPSGNNDARVIGTINGVVTDAANNVLLGDVAVTMTRGEDVVTKMTTATGHYAFGDLTPGTYVLTFVREAVEATEGKAAADAYAVCMEEVYIPTLLEVGVDDLPTHEPYRHNVLLNMDMFPLNGGAAGHVFDQSMTPRGGVTVVADFEDSRLTDQEFTTTTAADGSYSFSNLPTGVSSYHCSLRTLPFAANGEVLSSNIVDLDLSGGGVWQAQHLILSPAHAPVVTWHNFPYDVPFPVDGSFQAVFSEPMLAEGFSAQLEYTGYYDYEDKTGDNLVPVTVTVDGRNVTVTPNDDLMPSAQYRLTLAGHSTANLSFADTWTIYTAGEATPAVLSTNFNSAVPFPVDGDFIAMFNMAMEPSTFVAELYQGYGGGDLLPSTASWDGNQLTVMPTNPLEADTNYYLLLRGYSVSGQVFSGEWFLSTGAVPVPMATTNYVGVPFGLTDALVTTFSVPMDGSTFTIDFMYGGSPVLHADVWDDDQTLTITPTLPLEEDATYLLTLNGLSAEGVRFGPITYTINTLDLDDVRVIAHNMEDYFPLDGVIVVEFSEAMDDVSFDTGDNINLKENGSLHAFSHIWNEAKTELSITPEPAFLPGSYVELELDGQAANGEPFSTWSMAMNTFVGDVALVTAHNIVGGEFPLTGNLEFTFSESMDPDSFEFRLDGDDDNLHGVITWNEDFTVMTFDPDVTLQALTTYKVGIYAMTANGGPLSGGLDHMPDDDDYDDEDYYTEFDAIGGIDFVWTSVALVDGEYNHVPVDHVIQIHFNMELNLEAETTEVVLYNHAYDTPGGIGPIAIAMSYSKEDGLDGMVGNVLQIVPNQVLPENTLYSIEFNVCSTLRYDCISTDDLDVDAVWYHDDAIWFQTLATPTVPVEEVTDFVVQPDWEADFDTADIDLQWTRETNASKYYVYARIGDAAKADYFRVATVDQPADPEVTTIEATANLGPYADIYDTRDDDTPFTPFDGGQELYFIISGKNPLGEGPTSAEDLIIGDVISPTDGAFAEHPDYDSADFSGFDVDTTFTFVYTSNEYLDGTVAPTITVMENSFNDDYTYGDSTYVIDAEVVDYDYEDNTNGTTDVAITVGVAAGRNAAGDTVEILGLTDTSGNDYVAPEEDPAQFILPDASGPTNGWFDDIATSADASASATDFEVEVVYNANELLDDTVLPTVSIVEADEFTFGDPDYAVGVFVAADAVFAHVYTDTSAYTTVTFTVTVPAGFNGAGDELTIAGLQDLAGNVYDDDTPAMVVLPDTSAPTDGAIAVTAGQADATQSATDVEVTVLYTATELLDRTVLPSVTITETSAAIEGDPDFSVESFDVTDATFTDVGGPGAYTTVEFVVTVPAGENGAGDTVSISGLVDLAGNEYADTTPVGVTLPDATLPTVDEIAPGIVGATLDNSGGATPVNVGFRITASELLQNVLPTFVFDHAGAISVTSVTDMEGYSVMDIIISVPAGADYSGLDLQVNGLVDLVGNTQTVAAPDPAYVTP